MSYARTIKPRTRRAHSGTDGVTGEKRKRAATSAQDLRRRLARNVRRLRRARKLTVKQAADAAELGVRHWQRVEDGEANATITTLERLAAALEVRVAELFGRSARKGKR